MKKIIIYLIFFFFLISVFALEVVIVYKIKSYNSNSEIVNFQNSINIIVLILKSYVATLFMTLIGLLILYKKKISYKKQFKVLLIITFSLFVCFSFYLSQYIIL